MVLGTSLEIGDSQFLAELVVLPSVGIDVILGLKWIITPQCYGCINLVHSMSIIIYSKHIMIIIYLESCHSMQKCVLNCLNRLPRLMFE